MPEMATVSVVPAMVPVDDPVTLNALPAGAEPLSSASSKVTVSCVAFTAALEKAGGVASLNGATPMVSAASPSSVVALPLPRTWTSKVLAGGRLLKVWLPAVPLTVVKVKLSVPDSRIPRSQSVAAPPVVAGVQVTVI